MRCALSFDESKELTDQKLAAWGEMQPLNEDPAYKEEDIKSEDDKFFFFGFKAAFDDVCNVLEDLGENGEISKDASEYIQACMAGELAMRLFVILDHQTEEEENHE